MEGKCKFKKEKNRQEGTQNYNYRGQSHKRPVLPKCKIT